MMKMPSTHGWLLGIMLIAAWLTAGCGGGSASAPGNGTKGGTHTGTGEKTASASSKGGNTLAETVLRVGRVPFSNSSEMFRQHEGFMKYLKDELGVKEARLVTASNYEGILGKLERGEIDIGWLATLAYVDNKAKYKLKPLVKPVRFQSTSYRGIIIARGDSGIKNLSDLKGKKFAWVEKESASGYSFPKALLYEAGIDPDKDFAESAFLTKHDAVVYNVLLGKYDAGACYDDARKTLKDQEKINELTIIATTQDISNEPIVCRDDLPADLVEKVKAALLKLSYENPVHRTILENLTEVQGFVPAADSDYEYVRKMNDLLKTHLNGSAK
ncbi:MAG: phosphate/phosphite/phosphonate ABC transporter substrate-binding protein [Candidatus Riflebacteria bacterium]|nr:phosphate/phosphite/phosphonate ABC transporter substrate-binding protein [Candidatus Riflebacteria bacterium]